MYNYCPTTLRGQEMSDSIFFCFFITSYSGVIFRSNLASFSVHIYDSPLCFAIVFEPFHVCFCFSSGFWLVITLTGYNPTSWFGVLLSSRDSLRMWLHVDDVYFKILLVSVGGVEKNAFLKQPTHVWTKPHLPMFVVVCQTKQNLSVN